MSHRPGGDSPERKNWVTWNIRKQLLVFVIVYKIENMAIHFTSHLKVLKSEGGGGGII